MSMYNPFSLEGKTILVTGASSGIGQATAIECSKMGAKLVITGRDAVRLQDTFGRLEGDGHLQLIGELTNTEDVDALVASIPVLNGCVLCAGKGVTLPLNFATREKWDSVFDVNFFAPMELMRLCLKKKKLHKASSVVFVSSVGGTRGYNVGNGIYGASKAALDSAKCFFAKELAPKKIRVNSVQPGMVETPLIYRGTISSEQLEEDKKRYPLGRYGLPTDIAHGIIYLLSDASSWVTGQALVIDGGLRM